MSTKPSDTDQFSLHSQAGGSIVAELELDHEALVLRPTLHGLSTGRVEIEYWSDLEDGRTVIFFGAESVPFSEFEATLASDTTIDDPTLVDRYSRRRVYRATVSPETVRFTSRIAEFDGRILSLTGGQTGWIARVQFPNRDELVAFNRACKRLGISFRVNHLRLANPEDTTVVGLTEKQERLLTVAYEEGYFDVPRGISQDELAEKMGISKSAVSQRLRRAMNELCETSL